MKNLVNLKVSSRFARQILYLLIITSLIFLVIILSTKLLRNSSYKSTQTTFNQITKPIQLIDKEQNKTIKQGLPFIYQPSSQTKVLRALLTFYPNDQKDTFESEFRWFYRSWTEMMINESSLWRTDLIVYATIHEELFKNLDCVYNEIRLNAEEKPKCRVFPYIRIKDRESKHETSSKYQTIDKQRSQILFQHLKNYGYIDSINSVYEYNSSYSMYNYILRTDLDCFLTENFAFYVPYDHSLLVGNGGYSTEFNNKRLSRIAHDMNWEYANRSSLGSTWYGPPSMMYHLANYTLYAMLYLAINEFTRPEREQKVGVMLWPEWHYGVLLLYGGHLAINHLVIREKFDIGLANQLLDQGVTSKVQDDIRKNYRLHLHCWHGSEPFSKFQFKEGKYNHIQPSTLISDTSTSGYAMRLALESKLMTVEQLKQKLLDVKK